jgi:uncharacterized protein YlxP (DUF503 family)
MKPLLSRLRQRFNLSVAETGQQDVWQAGEITCVMVGNDAALIHATFQEILRWMEQDWPDVQIVKDQIEMI